MSQYHKLDITKIRKLGKISLVLGVTALIITQLIHWIPFLGLIATLIAFIGLTLSLSGLLLSLTTELRNAAMPLVGGFVCLLAFVYPLLVHGLTTPSLSEAEVEQLKLQMDNLLIEKQTEEENIATNKEFYISNNIELYDFEANYIDPTVDGRVPGVVFKIKNSGDRVLNQIEVTVYFHDAAGNTIAKEDFHPVLASGYFYSFDRKPLKPGNVWQQESGRFFSAKSISSKWDEGNATAEITDIEFAD